MLMNHCRPQIVSIVGMDINNTKPWEQLGSHIRVEIDDQGEGNFWKNIKTKYLEDFDILLDDASHLPEQFVTFVHCLVALKWILGHKIAAAETRGLYYPDGKVGADESARYIQ